MIVFEIRNKEEKGRVLGYLFYYKRSKRFYVELLDGLDEWDAPFLFSGYVKKGIYSIDSTWSRKFVEQRIIPSDRQNLGIILKENGLQEYDESKLLLLSEGRCAQDDLYLVRKMEKDILPEIRKRLDKKVLDAMVLREHRMLVFFRDGESRIVNIKELRGEDRLFGNILRDPELFQGVCVSPGGNGIEWGEERCLPAEELRSCGRDAEISYADVNGFVKNRLLDTAEMAKYLHCSRQNIKQFVDKGKLLPLREAGNTSLYRKAELEAE